MARTWTAVDEARFEARLERIREADRRLRRAKDSEFCAHCGDPLITNAGFGEPCPCCGWPACATCYGNRKH